MLVSSCSRRDATCMVNPPTAVFRSLCSLSFPPRSTIMFALSFCISSSATLYRAMSACAAENDADCSEAVWRSCLISSSRCECFEEACCCSLSTSFFRAWTCSFASRSWNSRDASTVLKCEEAELCFFCSSRK